MTNEVTKRFLENITIASPCHVNWDEMTGDEQTRFCNQCQKSVYNLSEMSRDEAERFMIEKTHKQGKVCIRMYVRHDGTVITDDCPVGLRKAKRALQAAQRRILKTVAACTALISSTLFGSAVFAQKSKEPAPAAPNKQPAPNNSPQPLMGEPCVPQLTPEQSQLEKKISEQISTAINAAISQRERPKVGSLQFWINNGRVSGARIAVTTGDKKLDDKIVALASATELQLPKESFPQWHSIIVNFTDTSKETTKESKKDK